MFFKVKRKKLDVFVKHGGYFASLFEFRAFSSVNFARMKVHGTSHGPETSSSSS